MSSPSADPAAVVLDRALDAALVRSVVGERLGAAVAPYLPAQRWFGDKDRPVREVELADVAIDADGRGWYVLAHAIVRFADSSAPADYLLLAAVLPDDGDRGRTDTLLRLDTPDGDWRVADIAAAPAFPSWWLSRFAAKAELRGTQGTFRWTQLAGFEPAARDAGAGKLILGGMGQSNTTVRYADALFGKIFRRLRGGINPDEEISRFLTEQTPFRNVPLPYGSASYESVAGTTFPVGVLFSFVPSVGDGWNWTQEYLTTTPLATYADDARKMGERTGQLHLALGVGTSDPDFAPELVGDADISHWEQATTAAVRAICQDLRRRLPDLAPTIQQIVQSMLVREQTLIGRVAGYRELSGTVKTRIHGDYHLGQLLRTPDADWVVLDFEGEPARTIEQRRAKTSPLKDVADMLRSFGYARGMAARAPDADHERLAGWEREARNAFLAGYRAEVAAASVPLAPADDAAFARAVAAWELAKAMYEIRYELSNRPDWLNVPLASLMLR